MSVPTIAGTVFTAKLRYGQHDTWITRRDSAGKVYYEPVDLSLRRALAEGRVNRDGTGMVSLTRDAFEFSDVVVVFQPERTEKQKALDLADRLDQAAIHLQKMRANATEDAGTIPAGEWLRDWATGGLGGPVGDYLAALADADGALVLLLTETAASLREPGIECDALAPARAAADALLGSEAQA